MSSHRCRLCTANDREALKDELAAELWAKHRGNLRDVPLDQAGFYWKDVFLGLAEDAMNLLHRQ